MAPHVIDVHDPFDDGCFQASHRAYGLAHRVVVALLLNIAECRSRNLVADTGIQCADKALDPSFEPGRFSRAVEDFD